MQLDRFDLALLAALQRDNLLTSEQLADEVALSPSACLRRVRRLREEKVIRADVARVDPAAIGRTLSITVLVSLESDNPVSVEAFGRAMRDEGSVLRCDLVTGECDIVLSLQLTSMEEFRGFIDRHLSVPGIRRFQTIIALATLKDETALPLDHLAG